MNLSVEESVNECTNNEGHIDQQRLRESWQQLMTAQCDIAFIGESGCGKSTLINRLLGLPTIDEDEYPETIEVINACDHVDRSSCIHTYAPASSKETTMKATPYSFENDSVIRLWDLPGYGATFYRTVAEYWRELEIDKYGAFVFAFQDNRSRPADEEALKYLLQKGKVVLFVRTNFDKSMIGRKRTKEAELSKEISERSRAQQYLVQFNLSSKTDLYCYSGLYMPGDSTTNNFLYDLDKLKETLIHTMPACQRFYLAQRFQGLSDELVRTKHQQLLEYLKLHTAMSAVGGGLLWAIPIVGPIGSFYVNTAVVDSFYKTAATAYGFLENGALNTKCDLSAEDTETVLSQIEKIRGLAYLNKPTNRVLGGLSTVPVVGALAAGANIGLDTSSVCSFINDAFRDAALLVVYCLQQRCC